MASSLFDRSLAAAHSTRELARVTAGAAAGSADLSTEFAVRSGRWHAVPEEYELGVRARARGELGRSVELLEQAAEQGSADAMFELGELAHRRGDQRDARRWFQLAAQHNPPRIQVFWSRHIPDPESGELRSLLPPSESRKELPEGDSET